jgi:hypothetical protein
VIAAQHIDVLRVGDHQGKKECDNFDGKLAAVNVVPEKKETRGRRGERVNEKSEDVIDIAVDIANNVEWRLEIEDNLRPLELSPGSLAYGGYQIFFESRDWINCANIFAV